MEGSAQPAIPAREQVTLVVLAYCAPNNGRGGIEGGGIFTYYYFSRPVGAFGKGDGGNLLLELRAFILLSSFSSLPIFLSSSLPLSLSLFCLSASCVPLCEPTTCTCNISSGKGAYLGPRRQA
jgi:hypothetical protein